MPEDLVCVYRRGISQSEAEDLARRINSFWWRFGVDAGARAVQRPGGGHNPNPSDAPHYAPVPSWIIKSKTINGLPVTKKWQREDLVKIMHAVDSVDMPI